MKLKNTLKFIFILLVSYTSLFSSEYSFRKYRHVKIFYADICSPTIEIGLKYNLPPAAIMAIAGLESGYGRGYVSQITGNILSLGAFKGDNELPILYLPYSKSSKSVVFDPKNIKKHSKNDLAWKKRPKSYKRDYRPNPYAGSTNNLELLKYDNNLKKMANRACLNDFATRWITNKSKVKVFKNAKIWLDKQISMHGVKILFDEQTNKQFIDMIGGHPHSFNYRETWPKKAKLIMKKVGLVELTKNIYKNNMKFNEVWDSK